MRGIDSIAALLNSLQLAEAFIASDGRYYDQRITWMDDEHLGLSMPPLTVDETEPSEDSVFQAAFEAFFADKERSRPPSQTANESS